MARAKKTGVFEWASLMSFNLTFARLLVLCFSLLISLLIYTIWGDGLSVLEERLGVLGWTLAPDTETEKRLTIVAIDERSIAEVGPWPWPRATMAKLTQAIDGAGAQIQLHDIVYSDTNEGDDLLIAALEEARGAVVAQVPVLQANSPDQPIQDVQVGLLTHSMTGADCNTKIGDASPIFPRTGSYIASHQGFSKVSKGHITPLISPDGLITKQPAAICVDGSLYPSLALTALSEATGAYANSGLFRLDIRVAQGDDFFGPPLELTFPAYPGLSIPMDDDGSIRVSYARSPNSFQAISAVDVLNGSTEVALLDNAWALIGATAFGLGDVVPTPFGGAAPGVELQARILASILDSEVPYSPRSAGWILLFVCAGFAFFLLRLASFDGRIRAFAMPAAAIVLPLAAVGLHSQLLSSFSIWLGWVLPSMFAFVAASSLLLLEQAHVRHQRNRVLSNLASYLPTDVAEEIAYSLPSSSISAQWRNVTLLSADLRNFSAFSEARPAEESAAVLHFFFQRATEVIESFGGRLHEFNGDSLLGIWDGETSDSAVRAYRAAQQMQELINRQLLQNFAPDGLEPLAVGIGLEQGPALIGSIGPAHRRSHALLGDTVTITIRIQELTSDLAQPVLLGECIARHLTGVELQSQGSYLLAGLTNPHVIFAEAPALLRTESNDSMPKLRVLAGGRR